MQDLERTTRILSEGLARAIDRRTFLKRASQVTAAGLMALAAGHGLAGQAAAVRGGPQPPQPPTPLCGPPGPYCNTGSGNNSGCHGAHCFQHLYQGQVIQCRTWFAFYPVGCWTTADSTNGGYWTCCDCECGQPQTTACGCAQWSSAPLPQPDRPGVGKSSN